jgi:hypothetical protein
MTDVSSWVAHATREPSSEMLAAMHAWWVLSAGDSAADLVTEPGPDACIWRAGPFHTLVMAHVDRAAHKRRRPVMFVSRQACDLADPLDHGDRPMSTVIAGDPYAPERNYVEHSVSVSSLQYAFAQTESNPDLLAITTMTEREFSDPEAYHEHSAKSMKPLKGGVVLPFMGVPIDEFEKESEEATADREDLLRAHGYSSYTIDIDMGNVGLDQHRELAVLIEDVFDEIAGIKADAAARVLTGHPLWPIIVVRMTRTWEYNRETLSEPMFAHQGEASSATVAAT